MESLKIDFSTQRGHEMVVYRDPPLLRGQMDEVDLNMLQAERVPRLLPVDWVELDGSMTFRYGIAGRRLLTHRLIGGPFGMPEYMALLLGIVEALEECSHYLLREQCCLIQERFLYVGEDWSDVRIGYLPLRDSPSVRPIREELLGLAVRLTGRISRVDGDGLQDVLRLLGDPAAPWADVRAGLLDAIGRIKSRGLAEDDPRLEGGHSAMAADPHADGGRTGDLPERGEDALRLGIQAESRGSAGDGHLAAGGFGFPASTRGWIDRLRDGDGGGYRPEDTSLFSDREWPGPESRRRDNRRARWLASAGALLSVAAAWRYVYAPAPGTSRLLASVGLTLLVLWGLSVIWRKLQDAAEEPPRSEPPVKDESCEDEESGAGVGWAARLRVAHGYGPAPGEADGHADVSAGGSFFGSPQAVQETAAGGGTEAPLGIGGNFGSEETTLLKEETVLLGGNGKLAGGGYFFLRESGGRSMRIPIPPGLSVIGRSAGLAQIVDGAEGVSRTHLEIECEGDAVRVRDLASRNGTLLDGEPMVPYKEYALRPGDFFRLAGAEGPKYTLERE